jgi:hypothetical protein
MAPYIGCLFYMIPLWLLGIALKNAFQNGQKSPLSPWRAVCFTGALVMTSVTAVAGFAFLFHWLRSGTGAHGMDSPLGLWRQVSIISVVSFWAAIILAATGKGKQRLLVYGTVASLFVVELLIMTLEYHKLG